MVDIIFYYSAARTGESIGPRETAQFRGYSVFLCIYNMCMDIFMVSI
jgi:hypothetical protein